MKVTIEDLSRKLSEIVELKPEDAQVCVRSLFDIISEELGRGNDIVMRGSFNLEVYQHKQRVVRNPHTNESFEHAFKKVRFKPCKTLREKINAS